MSLSAHAAIRLTTAAFALTFFAHLAQAEDRCTLNLLPAESGIHLTSAEHVAAGWRQPVDPRMAAMTGAAPTAPAMPAHCLIHGKLEERTGNLGKPYAIAFELRLPDQWNGRSLFEGGGGLDGSVPTAIGDTPIMGSTATPALARGYAVYSDDSGHEAVGMDMASFALDQQARLNYAYQSEGKMALAARTIIAAFYGRAAQHNFFMGCSNGGREALLAVERYPTLFDGVVAGNPGFRLSRAAVDQAWDVKSFLPAAPLDSTGKPILGKALTDDDLKLISARILEDCDALDGAKDGIVDAMAECHFQPSELLCKGEKNASCLSAVQVKALDTAFGGAHDSHGTPLYASWPYDTGLATPGWRIWKLGFSQTSQNDSLAILLGGASLGVYFSTPANPAIDMANVNFDFDTIADTVSETGALNDAVSTDLSTYRAQGGKLIVFHGNSDPVFSANDLRQWWDRLNHTNGPALADNARMFMIPGMTHCGGGPALDDIDPLTALEAWVIDGHAPATLTAKGHAFPGRQRPICAYPQEARYNGSGDVNSAASFHCEAPAK